MGINITFTQPKLNFYTFNEQEGRYINNSSSYLSNFDIFRKTAEFISIVNLLKKNQFLCAEDTDGSLIILPSNCDYNT